MPAICGKNGMVASASPLASAVGLKVLMDGGNAMDAAITTASMLSVDEPYFSGIGGHGIMTLYWAANGAIECLDFGGGMPQGFTIDQWGEPPAYPSRDVSSAIFPATLAGWAQALEKYGTLSLAETLQPVIHYAETGVAVRPVVRDFIDRIFEDAKQFPEFAKIFLPRGRVPAVGETLVYEDLAKTLRAIANEGVSLFYRGELAERMVSYLNAHGSRFTREEFASYEPRWRETIRTTYRDEYEIIVPKCQVCAVNILTQLNVWEHFDLKNSGLCTPDSLHVGIESAKMAFADRKNYCGDPDFSEVPYERLAAKAYAQDLAARITMEQVCPERPGDIRQRTNKGGTTHLTVVDRDGNAVAITQTIGPDFGCLHVIPGTGVILNNEGVYFDLDPVDGPNYPQAGKLSQHDMSPTLVLRDGKLVLALGTPGAIGITQTIPQVISNVIDHGLDIQTAIDADRYRYYGNGEVRLGEGISNDVRDALAARGHRLLPPSATPMWAGGFNAVAGDPVNGTLTGGADPRRGGLAVGY